MLLAMKCPKPFIQDKILKEKGIHMTAKDLQNINQQMKEKDGNQLDAAVKLLKTTYGITCLSKKFFNKCTKFRIKNVSFNTKFLYYY